MIELYSKGVNVPTGSNIPLNNVSMIKGSTATNGGVATIELNKCGVYEISMNAVASSTDESPTGDIIIQMLNDSVAVPQAIVKVTPLNATNSYPLSFVTLVQVTHNNTPSPCTKPTTIALENVGIPATYSNINVVVTKLV